MHIRLYTDLKNIRGKHFYLHPAPLLKTRREIHRFLDGERYFHSESFVRMALFGEEIKSNNFLEGYNDDIELINRAIKNASSIKNSEQKRRILNLYHAYQYILKGKEINRDTLRELYSIASSEILDDYSLEHMGKFHRKEDVYILPKPDSLEFSKGIPAERIDEFLDAYFKFLNEDIFDKDIDEYIKSQILHFYFVHIHPYFDVNGRTSRTLAMWYLLNKKCYPFIIFNRGISLKKDLYSEAIAKSSKTCDLTYFLKLMLETLQAELEKEYVIHHISEETKEPLESRDFQILHYFLSLYGRKTLYDLAYLYNNQNEYKSPREIYEKMVIPLIDKKILDVIYEKPSESDEIGDKVLVFKPLKVDPNKTKHS